ncbi:hypothetical protein M231_03198 [Tremella mesenterica]|uniref:Uncharacterized protein n=1 Tax=Tremella mesenterica TaxID=5217 RepID=A0A4Q1BNT5_TREME|nr:hypothetical protein M231_03198 [Tremella mesenterica]
MARDTRSSKEANVDPNSPSSPNNKRKRRQSPAPVPVPTPLKINLHIPSSSGPKIKLTPPKVNGSGEVNGDHEPKRARINLTVNGERTRKSQSPVPVLAPVSGPDQKGESVEEDVDPVQDDKIEVNQEVEERDGVAASTVQGRSLSREIRGALTILMAQAATRLPPPLNEILTLWLPPKFEQNEKNTLGYILKQDNLTWERLVDVLHVFSHNLLAPCAYPNPMPSVKTFHLPIPPLPSHLPPHNIYNFCVSLRTIMKQAEPPGDMNEEKAERWALMQKLPTGSGNVNGEWFTSSVDIRQVEALSKNLNEGKFEEMGSLLERLASTGTRFGHAQPVSLQNALPASGSQPRIPTLSDSLIRRASLKASRWKELRQLRRQGGFGSIMRPVTVPPTTNANFTPSFAPTFDSTYSSGSGYWGTLEGMHARHRHREWRDRVTHGKGAMIEGGYHGTMEADGEDDEMGGQRAESSRASHHFGNGEKVLEENARLLAELQAWQEIRIRRGHRKPTQREEVVAEEVLSSLTALASHVPPNELLPKGTFDGLAHDLAARFVPVSAPIIRGTLDPKRPQALHDNATVRMRSHVSQPLGSTSIGGISSLSPHQPPPPRPGPGGQMLPPPIPSNYITPPPHTLPHSKSSTPQYKTQPTAPRVYYTAPSPGQNVQTTSFRPPSSGSTYGRPSPPVPSPAPSSAPVYPTRPGPGPSSLRQSFGPENPAPVGSVYMTPTPLPLRSGTSTMISQQQIRPNSTPSRLR